MIYLDHISKRYDVSQCESEPQWYLKPVSLHLQKRETLAIVGPSGAGKTTLLNIIGLLDVPSFGDYYLCGKDTRAFNLQQSAFFRNQVIGFIFQFPFFVPHYTVLENVALPLYYRKVPLKKAKEKVLSFLRDVEMEDWAYQRPHALSGGQKQRVAIVRALIGEPSILLADEPTSMLDSVKRTVIMDLLFAFQRKMGFAMLVVTHDERAAGYCMQVKHITAL